MTKQMIKYRKNTVNHQGLQMLNKTYQHAWLLFAIALMAMMINIDYTSVNLSLITIANYFHSKLSTIQWILSGYMLAWAALIIPAGKATDKYGEKNICLSGIAIFFIGSIFAGLSQSDIILIIGRMIQGAAGAVYVPTLYALIFKHFPKHRYGIAMGIISIGIGAGMAIGPTFGGIILHYWGWRWIFLINIPICILSAIIIQHFTDKDQRNNEFIQTDLIANVLLSLSIIIFIYTVNQAYTWKIQSINFIAGMIVGIVLFVFFILGQQLSAKENIIPLHIFKNISYTSLAVAFLFEQYAFSASMVLFSIYLQHALGYSAFVASIIFLFYNAVFGIVSPFGGIIIDRFGVKWPATLGLVILSMGLLALSQLSTSPSPLLLYSTLMVCGLGMGFAFNSLNSGMLKTIDEAHTGIASSIFLLFALIGNTLGIVISTLVYESVAISHLIKRASQLIKLSAAQIQQLKQYIHYFGHNSKTNVLSTPIIQHHLHNWLTDSINHGLTNAMLVSVFCTIVAFAIIIIFLDKKI